MGIGFYGNFCAGQLAMRKENRGKGKRVRKGGKKELKTRIGNGKKKNLKLFFCGQTVKFFRAIYLRIFIYIFFSFQFTDRNQWIFNSFSTSVGYGFFLFCINFFFCFLIVNISFFLSLFIFLAKKKKKIF